MKKNNEPVRGTKDYLPKEMLIREQVKSVILNTYKNYGFMQIGTPVLEDIDNLLSSDGGDNLKLIFKVLKRGEKLNLSKPDLTEKDIVDIGLKYDQTVPLVRLFSNNANSLPVPFKSIQIDYSFRADRPQRGRTRQFTQCDIDILGDPSINAEIDIINTTAKTFANLGFKDFVAKINDRRILSDIISLCGFSSENEKEICISLDKLDKIGVEGVYQELITKFATEENPASKELENCAKKLMTVLNTLQQDDHKFETLIAIGVRAEVVNDLKTVLDAVNGLSSNGFKAEFDISIVRGQGYYTGMVYEFYMPGFSGACAGGGRYDNMIEKMTGKSIPAVGLGLGFEPTCMLIMEQNQNLGKFTQPTVAVIYREGDNFVKVLQNVQNLIPKYNASAILAKKNLSHQLETLKQNGFSHFVIFPGSDLKLI